jgi:hypothetical protein
MSPWLPVLIVPVPMIVFVGVMLVWLRTEARKRHNPLSRDLLRSPGQSLRDELRDVDFEILEYFVRITVVPIALYAILLSFWIEKGEAPGAITSLSFGAVVVAVIAFTCWKVLGLLRRRRNLLLGYEAEVATAEELNQLGRQGFWVFHDVPAEKSNIDHVVVGAGGIFAVETKGRAKPVEQNGQHSWEVTYDGRKLQFPTWSETEPLQQAERQANWLRNWLSTAVGERVKVQPVLALPGWYVRRTSGEGVAVISAREASAAIAKRRGTDLPEKLVQQIVHQLDQRCRNVEPGACRPPGADRRSGAANR